MFGLSLVVRMVSLRYGLVLGLSSRFGVSARFLLSVCAFCRFLPFPLLFLCSLAFSPFRVLLCFYFFFVSFPSLAFALLGSRGARCAPWSPRFRSVSPWFSLCRSLRWSVLPLAFSVLPCGFGLSPAGRSARGGSCLRSVASCGRFAFLVPFLGRTRVLVRLAVLVRFRC